MKSDGARAESMKGGWLYVCWRDVARPAECSYRESTETSFRAARSAFICFSDPRPTAMEEIQNQRSSCRTLKQKRWKAFFLAYFPYFEKSSRLMRSHCCPCVSVYPPLNFRTPELIFMKLGTYITAPEPISTAHFINPSDQSMCLYVYPPIVARQRLGSLKIPQSLLGNGSVETLPR
jgi:hypothetical protein